MFPEVPEIAIPGIGRSVIAIPEVAGGDHAKGTDGGERPALRTAQRVLSVTRVVDDLTLAATWQIEAAREHVGPASIAAAVTVARVSFSVVPSHIVPIPVVGAVPIVIAIAHVIAVMLVDGMRAGTATDRQRTVVVPVAVVSVSATWVTLVAVVAWIEVHTPSVWACIRPVDAVGRYWTQAGVRVRWVPVAYQSLRL
jgi:hypothetical protein